jgi:SAM-dependent methyltransferase
MPPAWSKTGVESNPTSSRIARANLPQADIVDGTFESAALDGQTYDVITAWDVVEHVINVRKFFEKVGRLLENGGIFVFETGCYASIYARMAGMAWNYYSVPDHVVFYSEGSIRTIAAELHFDVDLVEQGPHSRIHQLRAAELLAARLKALGVIAYSLRGKWAWPHDMLSSLLGKNGSLRNSYFSDHITSVFRESNQP